MDCAMLVFPTPGGPTNRRIGPRPPTGSAAADSSGRVRNLGRSTCLARLLCSTCLARLLCSTCLARLLCSTCLARLLCSACLARLGDLTGLLVASPVLRIFGPIQLEFSNRQKLQDAVLHVLETIVILVQDLRRQSEVDLVFGPDAPRELRHPLEERSDDLILGGLWTRTLQALEFPLHFCLLLLSKLQRLDPFPEVVDVVLFVFVAQLTLDLLELFA